MQMCYYCAVWDFMQSQIEDRSLCRPRDWKMQKKVILYDEAAGCYLAVWIKEEHWIRLRKMESKNEDSEKTLTNVLVGDIKVYFLYAWICFSVISSAFEVEAINNILISIIIKQDNYIFNNC